MVTKLDKSILWKEEFLVGPSVWGDVTEVMEARYAVGTPLLWRPGNCATIPTSSSPFHLRQCVAGPIHCEFSLLIELFWKALT